VIRLLFLGRKEVGARCLEHLLTLTGVEVVGVLTDNQPGCYRIRDIAGAQGLRLFTHEEAFRSLETGGLKFDLGVSMLYSRILRGPFIDQPRLGTINFHPAPLPDYRGTAGYNLAILENLSEWAVSAHYVDENIDTGPIIEVNRFCIDDQLETVSSIEQKSQEKLFQLFVKVVSQKIEADARGEARLPTSPNTGGRYVSRKEMEAMKEIRPGDDLARKIRAFWFPPYDGAYVVLDGQRYTLVDRTILQSLATQNPAADKR
jgi:methionyl-tRNA formyltransferase